MGEKGEQVRRLPQKVKNPFSITSRREKYIGEIVEIAGELF